MEFYKSIASLSVGIIKRLYYLIPSLFSDPFDISERWFGMNLTPPQWLFWLLLFLGLTLAVILAYHEVRMQKVGLERQLDQREKKRKTRVALGTFLEQGKELQRKCANEKELPPDDEANNWAAEVEEFLVKELDESYVSRFRSSAGVPLTVDSISSVPHRKLWAGIHTRIFQLAKFMEQLAGC